MEIKTSEAISEIQEWQRDNDFRYVKPEPNRKEIRLLKKKLLQEFLKEHEQYIPKYSPNGLKLKWDIYVSKDGNYDTLTGKFLGEYKVTIEQRRPRFLNIFDMNIYRYNTQTKELEETGEVWQLANVF